MLQIQLNIGRTASLDDVVEFGVWGLVHAPLCGVLTSCGYGYGVLVGVAAAIRVMIEVEHLHEVSETQCEVAFILNRLTIDTWLLNGIRKLEITLLERFSTRLLRHQTPPSDNMAARYSNVQSDSAYINGSWVRYPSSECFDVFGIVCQRCALRTIINDIATDPASGESIARVPDLDENVCVQAVEGASKAAKELKMLTGKARGRLLRSWFNLARENQEELAQIITSENGKTLTEARGEVVYATDFIDWFAGAAPRISGTVNI